MANISLDAVYKYHTVLGFPGGSDGRESTYNEGNPGSFSGLGKCPGEEYPLVFLPGESQGRGILVGFRLWGRTESDTTEAT